MSIKTPAIELWDEHNKKYYWASGRLYTEEEYLCGLDAFRMYSTKDPRVWKVVPSEEFSG